MTDAVTGGTVRGCVFGAARLLADAGEAEDGDELRDVLEQIYVANRAGARQPLHEWLAGLWRAGHAYQPELPIP